MMRRPLIRAALCALSCAAPLTAALQAQGVLIAPTTVFIDARVRSAELQLSNPGTQPVEVSIGSLFFGYPVSDSAGAFELKSVEHPDSTMPSAAGWIQAYPRIVTLSPRGQQVVRLLVRPPANLKDGEYWARLTVSARSQAPAASMAKDSNGVSIGLNLEVRTIIPVLYRKGVVQTGVRVDSVSLSRGKGDSLDAHLHLVRTGNSAFLGLVRAAVVDSAGKTVATASSPIAVYYEMSPRIRMATPSLSSGRYRLRIEVSSDRAEDLSPADVLQIVPIHDSVEVRLP